jgi:hypothetical protein
MWFVCRTGLAISERLRCFLLEDIEPRSGQVPPSMMIFSHFVKSTSSPDQPNTCVEDSDGYKSMANNNSIAFDRFYSLKLSPRVIAGQMAGFDWRTLSAFLTISNDSDLLFKLLYVVNSEFTGFLSNSQPTV